MTTEGLHVPSSRSEAPPPPFDPELAPVVEVLASLRAPDAYRPDTIIEMRQPVPGVEAPTDAMLSRDGAYDVEERTVPGPDGAPDVSLLICLPTDAPAPTPAIYHVHGGGMIVGDNRFGLPEMLSLAEPLGLAVVSVDYRLAPETPHPGPVEDCYAGLAWTAAHAGELRIDPGRIVVAGASAGGGLAAAVTLLSRDRGGPSISAQLLLSPMLDDRNDSPSAHQMRGLGIWDRSSNETGWNALLGDGVRGGTDVSPYAAPARADDLAGLPPTYVAVGSLDGFHDEDVDFALRATRAGVPTDLRVYAGAPHAFDLPGCEAAVAVRARRDTLAWLAGRLES